MSTDIQLKGDSLRRQLEQSRDFAARHGLVLVEGDPLHDIGVSAFKGANVKDGALGRFLEAVKAGRIERGSYLLVESLDRISRQEVMSSLAIFMEIINAGIHLATLADGHVYTAGTTDFSELIYSIMVMSRAHEESLTKSRRLGSAWANKRKNLATRKLTRRCPAWLTLSTDGTAFEVDPAKVEIVRSIFRDSASGIGSYSIARRLNKARVASFGRSVGWQVSYVKKLLTNRAVIGEFQPHRKIGGKRVPEGEPIRAYFPAIISEQLYQRVQQSRDGRRTGSGGRRGAGISNLFSGLATCGYCHAKMHFVNKGRGPKGGTYLVCDRARRGFDCERTGWRYDDFETSFLALVREIDLESLLRAEEDTDKRTGLARGLSALEGEHLDLLRKRDRVFGLIDEASNGTAFIRQKLDEVESEIQRVEAGISSARGALAAMEGDAGRAYQSRDEIKSLVARLQGSAEGDVFALRSAVASRLRVLVVSLQVYSVGTRPNAETTISMMERAGAFGEDEEGRLYRQRVSDHILAMSSDPRESRPCFSVAFRDDRIRIVFPDTADPLRFDEQIVSRKDVLPVRILRSGEEEDVFPQPFDFDWKDVTDET